MQSGTAKTKRWLLEYVPEQPKYIDPLMGWTGGTDTKQQLKLFFSNKEDAVNYATLNNIPFELTQPHKRKKIKKSYADNFAYKAPTNE